MEVELVTLHLVTLLLTAVFILIADHDALAYIRGKKLVLDIVRIKRLHYSILIGLVAMISSGAFMFADAWGELIEETAFYVKMLMVVALVANSFVIGNLLHIATQKPFATLSPSERLKLFISGGISAFCWLGAATIGLFFL